MTGKQKTPDQAAEAVVLREAGWTISAIAARMSISISTTQRLLKKHKAVAGAGSAALIEKARDELISTAFSLDSIQQSLASLVSDDMAISAQIRTKLSEAVEALDPNSPTVFRGLAASATALKLTQDVTRRALPLEKLNRALDFEELPELKIHLMTEDDVNEMRAKQRLEDAERNGDAQGIEDEIETLRWLEDQRQGQVRGVNDYDETIVGT
jgi:transcriptional regulator with XRE-family HTH domain